MSMLTGTYTELIFSSYTDYTVYTSGSTSELSLLAGTNQLPVIPANFFTVPGKTIELLFAGTISTGGAYTLVNKLRFHTSAVTAVGSISGTVMASNAAATTQSGITTQQWEAIFRLTCTVPGVGTGAATFTCNGWLDSPGGLASPFRYALQGGTPPSGTWTSVLDSSLSYYPNLTATFGTTSASNAMTVKRVLISGLN